MNSLCVVVVMSVVFTVVTGEPSQFSGASGGGFGQTFSGQSFSGQGFGGVQNYGSSGQGFGGSRSFSGQQRGAPYGAGTWAAGGNQGRGLSGGLGGSGGYRGAGGVGSRGGFVSGQASPYANRGFNSGQSFSGRGFGGQGQSTPYGAGTWASNNGGGQGFRGGSQW